MKKKKHFYIRLILLLLFGTGMVYSLINLKSWKEENKKVEEIVEEEKERLIEEKEETFLDPEILKDNPDTVGWLIVDGTDINYPVVQYKNNDYYLFHDFKKEYNTAGWVFMDYQNTLDDQNIVIYGHNRQDDSMFGSIDNLFNQTGDKELEIKLITFDREIIYKIFSVYKINAEDPYTKKNFESFSEEILKFKNRSKISFNQDISTAKQIITLSTCHQNNKDRAVVHGYKN